MCVLCVQYGIYHIQVVYDLQTKLASTFDTLVFTRLRSFELNPISFMKVIFENSCKLGDFSSPLLSNGYDCDISTGEAIKKAVAFPK